MLTFEVPPQLTEFPSPTVMGRLRLVRALGVPWTSRCRVMALGPVQEVEAASSSGTVASVVRGVHWLRG